MNNEIKEKFYSLEELKRTIDCYDGYLDNEEVYYFIGALRFAYDYITNLQQKCEELECDLEELTFSYNQLEKELREKKEQCNNLIGYVNPYHYYGVNENNFH